MLHSSDQSKVIHPDWRKSSGVALPTVADLHYGHYFKIRANATMQVPVVPLHTTPVTRIVLLGELSIAA